MKSSKMKILAILVAAIFLISSVYAATLCSYKGFDVSEHDLQLSEFKVSGDTPVRVDDKISAEFKLTYVGKYAVTFDDKYGVFVAAKDPDGVYKTFGNTYQGKTLKAGESVNFKTDVTVDKEGEWVLWASYCIKVGKGTKCGPNEWHSCKIKVEAKPICPEGCECLTEAQAKELGYEYCEGEKTLCGYDQYQNSMYCYQKLKEQDSDNDGIPDEQDNCPNNYNPQQEDSDNDGIGNECDTCDDRDSDGDGIKNYDDQCPNDAETFNGYMDDDGCPDEKPEEEPSTPESTPPTMSIKKIPENPVLGDRVRYEVSASDESGIAIVKIFMNGEKKRTCFASSCDYTTRPIEEEPEVGALAVDMLGNCYAEGVVPEEEIEDLRIEDLRVLATMRDISDFDHDHDGVLDTDDECCPGCGGLLPDNIYCCEDIVPYSGGCRDNIRRYLIDRYVYYWEDFYGYVSDNGCGCYDSDGGGEGDIFRAGFVAVEGVSSVQIPQREFSLTTTSNCKSSNDECISTTNIREYSCGPDGVINQTVQCPAGTLCSRDSCNCPDTDGGWDYFNRGTLLDHNDSCSYHTTADGSGEWWLQEYGCGADSYGRFIVDSRDVRCAHGCRDDACKCQDSDGGWNPDVFGHIGTHEDICLTDSDRILSEVDVEIIETDDGGECRIIRDNYTCSGLCDSGMCLPPTCDDRILNQDEEDVDCGGLSCLPCDLCHADLPDKFDWRNWKGKNWMTPVKDQGDECGACWAFAAVGVVEAKYNIENTGVGEPINRSAQLNLSEQQLVSACYGGYYCGGGGVGGPLAEIRDDGIPDAACFPYEGRTTHCRPCNDWSSRAWTIDERNLAAPWDADGDDDIRRKIICEGPISTCGHGHCLVIVGWDGGWIIKNSWGPLWEDGGYDIISYDHDWTSLDSQKYYVRGVRRL